MIDLTDTDLETTVSIGEESKAAKLADLPNGRKMDYQIFRCCERFGWCLDDFYNQDKTEQKRLLAYTQIRELEEAHLLQATMSMGMLHV